MKSSKNIHNTFRKIGGNVASVTQERRAIKGNIKEQGEKPIGSLKYAMAAETLNSTERSRR